MPSNSKRSAPSPNSLPKQAPTANASKTGPTRPSTSAANTNDVSNKSKSLTASTGPPGPNPAGNTSAKDSSSKSVTDTAQVLAPTVNRKKQKRRLKQAARLAEQQAKNGYQPSDSVDRNGEIQPSQRAHGDADHSPGSAGKFNDAYADHYDLDEDEEAYHTDDEDHYSVQSPTHLQTDYNGLLAQSHDHLSRKSKKKKHKKGKSGSHHHAEESSTSPSTPSASARPPPPPPPPLSNAALRSAHKISRDRIWNTSTQEERENIKEFWLQLGEEERRSLVKVEKEAVLRKMKEQQKHSCSCTVCGRKRTAIEEELEVLYDAYYEELEQYANHNQASFENGAPIVPPPRLYQPPLRSLDRHSHLYGAQHPSRGRVQELPDDDDYLDEDYDEDEEDDEPYSDDDLEEVARTTRADFFAFGNSLTVKDGILTVADDLLKNDGKHFIDMMEQLAERRMQREEDTQYAAASAAHQSMHAGHNHGPPLDEEDYDDEEEDDYDSQDDEEYEEDEMDAMTEEQRMEEGRRMFQIFAARMFEQRVLTAYREKVARERQQKLLEEIAEESRADIEREAKKAREAQKKRDKKRLQRQAKEEEKAKKEAEKAAEAARLKELEEKKLEEQRRKKEEQRKKKEAERKAQEEARLRKDAEKQKRLQEERERQAEAERKQRENKEREKKRREEKAKREREEREAKEKEQRERKAKVDQERKAREEHARRQKEAATKADQEASERNKREEHATQAAKRTSQSGPAFLPPGLQHPHALGILQSPHFQVATPVVPKAPTPVRPRQASQQGSHASSPRSQPTGTDTSQSSISPGNGPSHSGTSSVVSGKGLGQPPILHHPQPSAPLSPLGVAGRGAHGQVFSPIPALNGMPSNAPGLPGMAPRIPMGHEVPLYANHHSQLTAHFRAFASPDAIPIPPGINGVRPMAPGRGFPLDTGHGLPFHPQQPGPNPISSQPSHMPREAVQPPGHARQLSTSYDRSLENLPQNLPISRPAPIQRPASTAPHDQSRHDSKSSQSEIDELSTQLGSSALLDDTDVPLTTGLSQPIPTGALPGPPGSGRMGYGTSPLFSDPLSVSKHPNYPLGAPGSGSTWGSPMSFSAPGFPGAPTWAPGAGSGWPSSAFGIIGGSHRLHPSRPVTIRLLVSQACKHLNASSPVPGNSGYHNANDVLRQAQQLSQQLNPPLDSQITLNEMLDICDTEGNPQNGGGSFHIMDDGSRGTFVKFDPGYGSKSAGPRGSIAPGDIGSPIPGSSVPNLGGIGSSAGNSRQLAPGSASPSGF
ncbi:hypothetical protein AJ80_02617 [Polytolypa hystricis UAMH7299]|uniref:Stress response protein NST1 n=1 Tax=Polytolypa hystricis (strain UAMH7299) TaxID=1447883 RepID=A0A2B7YH11_POLH7|nr:hypothetical protein AJ80_02617 [Polytolypa hystricis UAMH7299]